MARVSAVYGDRIQGARFGEGDYPYWTGPETVTLAQELFHIGFYNTVYLRSEVELDSYPLQWVLTTLQYEGLAGYTAYTAERIYPAPLETGNRACEGMTGTQRLLTKRNRLLGSADSPAEDELMQQVHAVGV